MPGPSEIDAVALFYMLNNFLHDFAVALLLAALFVIWLVGRPKLGLADAALRAVYARLAKLTYACWAVILIGGAIRTAGYREYEWSEAAGRGQVTALLVKHILLGALVLIGVFGQWRLRRRLKS